MIYETYLANVTTEAEHLQIMRAFRDQYGWHEHHPNHCCRGTGHPLADASATHLQEKALPVMSAPDYQFVLLKAEREKEEYKKRIFL